MNAALPTHAAPPATPHRFMREDALAAVVVDEPDFSSVIDFHAGVAVYGLTVKESATLVGDNPDYLVGTDLDWVKTIRRWPPQMVTFLDKFWNL